MKDRCDSCNTMESFFGPMPPCSKCRCNAPHPDRDITCKGPQGHGGRHRDLEMGVVWEIGTMPACGEQHPALDVKCDRPRGHQGAHESPASHGPWIGAGRPKSDFIREYLEGQMNEESVRAAFRTFGNTPKYQGSTTHKENAMPKTYKVKSLVKILKDFLKRLDEHEKDVAKRRAEANAKIHEAVGEALEAGEFEYRGETIPTDERSYEVIVNNIEAGLDLPTIRTSDHVSRRGTAQALLLQYESIAGEHVELTDHEFDFVARFANYIL